MPFIQINIQGRLGNAMFRHLISRIFIIESSYTQLSPHENMPEPCITVTDSDFIKYFLNTNITCNSILNITNNMNIRLIGYVQHEAPLLQYKDKLKQYILANPDEYMYTEHIDTQTYTQVKSSFMLYSSIPYKIYTSVLHLRLGDFIPIGQAVHPDSYKNILDSIPKPITVIVDTIKTFTEQKYINYLKSYTDCIILQNPLEEDYHTMRNAEYLVCSMSTLSWIAAFWNDTHKQIYMPRNIMGREHCTFQNPSSNTTIFDTTYINETDILNLQEKN
jgi:hypothetical protein